MLRPTVAGKPDGVSPALRAAQARLMRMRQERQSAELSRVGVPGRTPTPWLLSAPPIEPPTPEPQPISNPTTTRLWPDLALAMLREEVVAPGRVWLLLRLIDEPGRGWVSRAEARQLLTERASDKRICGWRQLRNLFKQGQPHFWQQDSERIWLKSPAKVAKALGLDQLTTRPVALPIAELTQSIGRVRAHFYASFHSGRKGQPIARQTLTDLCAVSRATQRTYEAQTGVRAKTNWAIGPLANKLNEETCAWQHGQATFKFKDRLGKLGEPGRTYMAWQLPNSYQGPHQTLSKRPQKRLNRHLADLLTHGITGNGERMIETRFCTDGRQALTNRAEDSYWPSDLTGFWHQTAFTPLA